MQKGTPDFQSSHHFFILISGISVGMIEDAVTQIGSYLAGDTDSHIACDEEGSLYQLFHTVNTLATALGAHAANEQKVKEFLKETISDISHQLKTPLSALTIYNSFEGYFE